MGGTACRPVTEPPAPELHSETKCCILETRGRIKVMKTSATQGILLFVWSLLSYSPVWQFKEGNHLKRAIIEERRSHWKRNAGVFISSERQNLLILQQFFPVRVHYGGIEMVFERAEWCVGNESDMQAEILSISLQRSHLLPFYSSQNVF